MVGRWAGGWVGVVGGWMWVQESETKLEQFKGMEQAVIYGA